VLNMLEAKHMISQTQYASGDDFCRIFYERTDELYQLSFLLTADHKKAEQCFVSGLENSVKGNRVFKEWARSWARRAIIQCAVRAINPKPMKEDRLPSYDTSDASTVQHGDIAAILELRPFERFVYVMSVLERYSDQDCSVLLGCARRDVGAARSRALQQVGSAMESELERELNVA
jgi:DNA-directed RNA polymerase specialized sigma24 family protein